MASRPKVAVFNFAACDGCQLAVRNLENELAELSRAVEIVHSPDAGSTLPPGPYDVAFVQGTIATEDDATRIRTIRDETGFLVALGACTTTGGTEALRTWKNVDEFVHAIYATPETIESLETTMPIGGHVRVDAELNGCPVDTSHVLEVIASIVLGRAPHLPSHPVCIDCKRDGNVCVMVAQGMSCLGPVTHTGCGAVCPRFGHGCSGCFGWSEGSHPEALAGYLLEKGEERAEIMRMLRFFAENAETMREARENSASAEE